MANGIYLFSFLIGTFLLLPQYSMSQSHSDAELGLVEFKISCNKKAQEEFTSGLAQLHHMMYQEARPHFQRAAKADKNCAMAWWGLAMTRFQPLWHPSGPEDLKAGKEEINKASKIGASTERERDFIATAEAFFTDPEPPASDPTSDHEARVKAWMESLKGLHAKYPEDEDAAAFYALSEVAYAMTQFSPAEERDYTREKCAGAILERFLEDHPDHPGLFHYLIHAYDSPLLAPKAEEVARKYDKLAPETPHALHMPSHIFVRLGKWKETAEWNERSAKAALHHAANGHISLHYPHALDYLMYAYLQLGNEEKAKETLTKAHSIGAVQPHFASAYGVAAPQARFYLEQQKWKEAAELEPAKPDVINWKDFPGALAIFHYARGLGAARSGDLKQAKAEQDQIDAYVKAMNEAGDEYWAHMTGAMAKAVDAWILYEEGKTDEALRLMAEAAEMEESMDKHPITPGEILPVRELYGELLLREGQPEKAIEAFNVSLERTPNRRYALKGIEAAKQMK